MWTRWGKADDGGGGGDQGEMCVWLCICTTSRADTLSRVTLSKTGTEGDKDE